MLFDPKKDFLPASAMDAPEWVIVALDEVLRRFEAGEIIEVHRDWKDPRIWEYPRGVSKDAPLFNMSVWGSLCGSVKCAGGWTEAVAGRKFPDGWRNMWQQFYELCHPMSLWGATAGTWDKLTMEQACRAIRHYRRTGRGVDAW